MVNEQISTLEPNELKALKWCQKLIQQNHPIREFKVSVDLLSDQANFYPELTLDQEKILLDLMHKGFPEAGNTLLLCHLRWAYKLVMSKLKVYNAIGYFLPVEELLQDTYTALYEAILNFDSSKAYVGEGSSLKAYAKYVCNTAIQRYFRKNAKDLIRPISHGHIAKLHQEHPELDAPGLAASMTIRNYPSGVDLVDELSLKRMIESFYKLNAYIGDVTRAEILSNLKNNHSLENLIQMLVRNNRLDSYQLQIVNNYIENRKYIVDCIGLNQFKTLMLSMRRYLEMAISFLDSGSEELSLDDSEVNISESEMRGDNNMIDAMDLNLIESTANRIHLHGFSIYYYHVCEGRSFQNMEDEQLIPGLKRSSIFNVYKKIVDALSAEFTVEI